MQLVGGGNWGGATGTRPATAAPATEPAAPAAPAVKPNWLNQPAPAAAPPADAAASTRDFPSLGGPPVAPPVSKAPAPAPPPQARFSAASSQGPLLASGASEATGATQPTGATAPREGSGGGSGTVKPRAKIAGDWAEDEDEMDFNKPIVMGADPTKVFLPLSLFSLSYSRASTSFI